MKNLQMGGVHRIFHRLKPVTVELRLDEDFSVAILPEPDIQIRYQRHRFRTQIAPIKTDQLLHRIGLLLDGQMKFTFGRLGGWFQAIAFSILKPTVIRPGDTPLLDATVTERSAAGCAAVIGEPDPSLLG